MESSLITEFDIVHITTELNGANVHTSFEDKWVDFICYRLFHFTTVIECP